MSYGNKYTSKKFKTFSEIFALISVLLSHSTQILGKHSGLQFYSKQNVSYLQYILTAQAKSWTQDPLTTLAHSLILLLTFHLYFLCVLCMKLHVYVYVGMHYSVIFPLL